MKYKVINTKQILTLAITPFVLTALCLTGCQKNELSGENGFNDGTVKYAVAMGYSAEAGNPGTKAVLPDAQPVEGNVIVLTDKTGTLSIPMECEVTEGIGNPAAFSAGASTKGELINTSGSDVALSEFLENVSEFPAIAYDGEGHEKVNQTVSWDEEKSAWAGTPVAYWPQATNLTFFSCANLPGEQTATIDNTGVSTSHTVPATAAEQTDILFGYYNGKGGNTSTAEIHFEHPLTAVRFLYGEIDKSISIRSISIEGVAASGTAKMALDGTISWDDVTDFSKTVSQELVDGLAVNAETSLIGEPFILIPQRLSIHAVTVSVTLTDGEIVSAVIAGGQWQAGKTNTYRIGIDHNTVQIDVDDTVTDNVKSDLQIMNKGISDAYFRVALIGCWKNDLGWIVESWDESQGTFEDFPGTDWVKGDDGYYYYTNPVEGADDPSTPTVIESLLFSSYQAPEPPESDAVLSLDIIVQAVKYDSSKNKVAAAWGSSVADMLNTK